MPRRAQPASRSTANFIEPAESIDWTYSSASMFSLLLAVGSPSGDSPPPACAMNAPRRWNSVLVVRPTWVAVVSFWATVLSSSHVVGMSSSVRPAASHSALLITSARVEKSLGAQ